MAVATAARSGANGNNGAHELPSVLVTGYNLEVRDADGFLGDKASRGAFMQHLADLRAGLDKIGADPLDHLDEKPGKSELDALLDGEAREAALVLSAVEHFSQALAGVIRRFLRQKSWAPVERIVVGGGFRQSRIGELAIARASIILQTQGVAVELVPIRHHPDEAGLVGAAHLAPKWIFEAYDSMVGIDIGGSNIRTGIVELRQDKARDLSKARVWESELWRHADDTPSREEAVERLGEMLKGQIRKAKKEGLRVAPFIGVGCPGLIEADGAIERGGQNLPGNWESSRFNLVESLRDMVPTIGEHETVIAMHNDAVVQGLSEMPFMQDVEHWAVLTIGTGLGNASYQNRTVARKDGSGADDARSSEKAKARQKTKEKT